MIQSEPQCGQFPQSDLFQSGRLRILILGVLFLTAFGIRFYHIKDIPGDFHPSRQYRSAIIARGYYYEALTSVPEWRRHVASVNKQRQGIREPPIMEFVASVAYKIIGEERIWVPRLLSTLFWLVGGGFLYRLVKKFISNDAAVLCTAFYLFTPFGIRASRSFQPDALMVMGLVISTLTTVQYYERRSCFRFFTAVVVAAVAISIKFVSLFAILGAFLFAGFYTDGFRTFITSRRCITFLLLAPLPSLIFYSYGVIVTNSLTAVAQLDIMPHLPMRLFFWRDWAEQIVTVVSFPGIFGAIIGVLLFRDRLGRGLLIGLWSGYFIFGLIFSYTISTHDYWSLQIIPIIAFSLGPVGAIIMNGLGDSYKSWYSRLAASAILIVAVLLSAYGTRPALISQKNGEIIKTASEIGKIVGHSTRTVFLAPQYGWPLVYYGELSGAYWPRPRINAQRYARPDERELTIQERLSNIGFRPEYFIITDFEEFNKHHSDLKKYLSDYCPLIDRSKDYLIYGACA